MQLEVTGGIVTGTVAATISVLALLQQYLYRRDRGECLV
jgi:hypothetical protein